MFHVRAEPGLISARNVVAIRPMAAADRLEHLSRKPLTPHRRELRMLAERLRALEALGHEHAQQLTLEEVA